MLSETGRRIRILITATVLTALLWGTFWGNDDNFPFGPFRMYSTANELDGRVNAALFVGLFADGTWRRLEIRPDSFGLRRAEIEGQKDRFATDPSLLRYVVEAYAKRNPRAPRLEELRLYQEVSDLEGGRRVGEPTLEEIARWAP